MLLVLRKNNLIPIWIKLKTEKRLNFIIFQYICALCCLIILVLQWQLEFEALVLMNKAIMVLEAQIFSSFRLDLRKSLQVFWLNERINDVMSQITRSLLNIANLLKGYSWMRDPWGSFVVYFYGEMPLSALSKAV